MRFARPRAVWIQYLDAAKQAEADRHWNEYPDAIGNEVGNEYRCWSCGAPPGKQCMKADASFRNYPHQNRRDQAHA